MPRKHNLLRQGDLDGLCGPYAILNAIRLASARQKNKSRELDALLVDDDIVSTIFLRMMQTVAGRSIADPVYWGIGTGRLWRLLRVTTKVLRHDYGLELSVFRPFGKRQGANPKIVLARIEKHLQDAGTAVIVGSRVPWSHWTTVRSIGRTRLLLADSGGYHYVPLSAGKSSTSPHAGLIESDCVFFLRLTLMTQRIRFPERPQSTHIFRRKL